MITSTTLSTFHLVVGYIMHDAAQCDSIQDWRCRNEGAAQCSESAQAPAARWKGPWDRDNTLGKPTR